MLKILPIFTYHFLNTQNQYFDRDTSGNVIIPDFIKLSYVEYPSLLNEGHTEDNYFGSDLTPTTYKSDCGSLKFNINLSKENFNEGYVFDISQSMKNNVFDMKLIKFIIIYDDITKRKYYYFVEDITQLNALTYSYNLSLDTIKTYFNEIQNFSYVKPLRYHIPTDELDFLLKQNIFDYVDPLIQNSQNVSVKLPLLHLTRSLSNAGIHYGFSGIWEYYYMGYSSDDDEEQKKFTQFKNENYYIIPFPKSVIIPDDTIPLVGNSIFSNHIKNAIAKSPYLLKVVESDIPPFNYNLNLNTSEFETFSFLFNQASTINHNENVSFNSSFIDASSPTQNFSHYSNNDYLQWKYTRKLIGGVSTVNDLFPVSLRNILNALNITAPCVLFQTNDNPNNILNNLHLIHTTNPNQTYSTLPTITNLPRINLKGIKQNIKVYGESNLQSELLKMFDNAVVGYENNQKMPILKRKLYHLYDENFNDSLVYRFTSVISHSLNKTIEKILYSSYNPITTEGARLDYEVYATREEMRKTQINDEYFNYVYLNKNAIEQKDKQLEVYQPLMNIANLGFGMVTASSGLGAMQSGFNFITNAVNNQIAKENFKASLQDKRLTPLNYKTTTDNTNDQYKEYIPYLTFYRATGRVYNTLTMFNDIDTMLKENAELLRLYGWFTPNVLVSKFKDLFTRINYNYTQIDNVDEMKLYSSKTENGKYTYTIPNEHLRLILEILRNGVSWRTSSYVVDDNEANGEY